MSQISMINYKKQHPVGTIVTGIVTKHFEFGLFIDLGCEAHGFIDRINISDNTPTSVDSYPQIGMKIKAKVLGYMENFHHKPAYKEIALDLRPSQLKSNES